MAKKNKIYVTTMYKFGQRANHSYVLYAGFSKSSAIQAGADEFENRGEKYKYEVVEFTPDDMESERIVYDL